MNFTLRFHPQDISYWADRYDYAPDDTIIDIGQQARERGHLIKPEFLRLAYWKSPRSQPRCARNMESFIEEVTRIALNTKEERLRIDILRLMHGVDYPTASVILHVTHSDPYPIIDYRALWSLGIDETPRYTFDFWWAYTQVCREIASGNHLSMRTLDRALWQYSKECQPTQS